MAGSDPITAVFNAIAQAGVDALPFINEHLAQKYEKEHQQRLAEWSQILADPNPAARADRMHDFVLRMLSLAGSPSGDVGGVVIPVPLDTLNNLLSEVSEGIKKDAILARLQFKEKS